MQFILHAGRKREEDRGKKKEVRRKKKEERRKKKEERASLPTAISVGHGYFEMLDPPFLIRKGGIATLRA
ncbi:MAG: hypothetical protein QM537_09860, partial [Candidatus Symbiobacter sp.]|nr:hypothetical protein [Candidatus Symbiobacter sp.]